MAGHEAARLGSQLAASQRQRRDAERSTIVEPRARSYDYQRQDKSEKGELISLTYRCRYITINSPLYSVIIVHGSEF